MEAKSARNARARGREGEELLLMAPGPVKVLPRILDAMSKPVIYHRGSEFAVLYEEIVNALKEIFQTENDIFVLSGSGTCAMEAAIGNLVQESEKVLCISNGKFGERFFEIASRYGEAVALRFEWGSAIDASAVRAAVEEHEPAVVTMVHNETSTGVLNPAAEVGRIVKANDAIFVLDCITSIGGDDVPVDKIHADIAIVGSQKCLGAPPGLSALSVSEEAWEKIAANKRRKPYYMDLLAFRRSFEKRQTPYTPAIPLFAALHEALRIIQEEGLRNRIRRHRTLAKAVREAVKSIGLSLFPKVESESAYSNTVTAINLPEGITDAEMKTEMRKRGIIIVGGQDKVKGKIFRIATMGNVTAEDVFRTIEALEDVLFERGILRSKERGAGIDAAERIISAL